MKITFGKIKELLEDPFFEVRYLGKDAIRQCILPVDKCSETSVPVNLRFIGWEETDCDETIQYSFADTLIGRLLIGNTTKGVCFLGFSCGNDDAVVRDMQKRFPQHRFEMSSSNLQKMAVDYCNGNHDQSIFLHMKGTVFQLKIWETLVLIPEGRLSTYGSLSPNTGAAQAIGAAVGANPVSYIVPCHRVVKKDGDFRGYHWGSDLKKLLLAYELQK